MHEKRWAAVAGISTVATLAVTVFVFLFTEQATFRDFGMLFLGFLLGGFGSATVASLVFYSDRRERSREEARILANKKASLIEELQTRTEAARVQKAKRAELQIAIATANANAQSLIISAQDASRHGFADIATDNLGKSKTWIIQSEYQTEELAEIDAEIARLSQLTDEQYMQEAKHLRGLD